MAKTDTKNRLVQSAMDLFHRHGFHRVSFQDIAKRVGISQPALYKHFADKDELLGACSEYAAQQGRLFIDQLVSENATASDRLYSYMEANLRWAEEMKAQASTILAMYYIAYHSKPVSLLFRNINTASVQRLDMILQSGLRERCWKRKDTARVARWIHNLLIGEMMKLINAPEELKRGERMELLWDFASQILHLG